MNFLILSFNAVLGGDEPAVCEREQHHHVPGYDQREDCRAERGRPVLGFSGIAFYSVCITTLLTAKQNACKST